MKLYNIFDFVISLILWILIVVILVPIVLLLFLWKRCVIFIAHRVDKNLHATQPNDTYFSVGDTNKVPIVNVAQIWRVEGMLDIHEFRAHFRSLFFSCPESRKNYLNLYCYLKHFGGYVFKRSVDQVNVEEHVVMRQLPEDETLQSFIVKWMLRERFEDGKPLWQVVLLHLPSSEPNSEINVETVVLLKMHHCMTDGYGFIHIVDKLTGNTSPYLVTHEKETLFQMVKASFFGPKTLMDYVIEVARTPDLFYPLKDRKNAQWFMSLNTLDMKKIKDVRRRTKAHFISVMMTLMIGALRRYLHDTYGKDKEIPNNIWTANSLPWPGHPRNSLVNHWTGGVFQVPFKTEDPLERLCGTEKFFKFFHDMEMHKTVKRLIIPVTWCLPSPLLRWGHSLDLYYFRYSNAFASLLLSESPHFMLGKRVKQLYLPLGIKDAVPTSVLFGVSSSHSGQMDLSLLASSEVVASQEALDKIATVYFAQELEQLQRSIEDRIIPILESDCETCTLTEKDAVNNRINGNANVI
ncbi:unnamed protein product [Orchesella dallaii]|uniref:Diacylglycerol O-acyltransferase n=1 Tax=Orchesella dallaii TaxID=48710 RepID=A0ABP1QJB6_9HEXA